MMSSHMITMIRGEIQDNKCLDGELLLNNFVDTMRSRSHKAKPDVYFGARSEPPIITSVAS